MSGIVGRIEFFRELYKKYGPFESLNFIIKNELGCEPEDLVDLRRRHKEGQKGEEDDAD